MVMVIVAGALENNDCYRVQLDMKVNSFMIVPVYFSLEVHYVVILSKAFLFRCFQWDISSFFPRCSEHHNNFHYINLTFSSHILR